MTMIYDITYIMEAITVHYGSPKISHMCTQTWPMKPILIPNVMKLRTNHVKQNHFLL